MDLNAYLYDMERNIASFAEVSAFLPCLWASAGTGIASLQCLSVASCEASLLGLTDSWGRRNSQRIHGGGRGPICGHPGTHVGRPHR